MRQAPGFPPEVVVSGKALACALPATLGIPLGRLHVPTSGPMTGPQSRAWSEVSSQRSVTASHGVRYKTIKFDGEIVGL